MTVVPGQPLKPRQVVGGHYRIIQLLGAGNFGDTYLAEDLYAMERKCAVKRFNFVNKDSLTFDRAKDLFEREASVLLQLSQPPRNDQIPLFYAYFEENRQFYLVQEFIEGHPLSDELQKGKKLREGRVVEILSDVLPILEFIHSKGIIHRDIKPENLMRRNRDGKLVLIDFGAVKEVLAQSATSRPQTRPTVIYIKGYTPKEQLQGEPKPNSDIYALGMTAIQALTGLDPKDLPKDSRLGEVIWRNKAQVSNGLAQILSLMIRDDSWQRYESAQDVINKLQKPKKNGRVTGRPRKSAIIFNLTEWFRANPPSHPLRILAFIVVVGIVIFLVLPIVKSSLKINCGPLRALDEWCPWEEQSQPLNSSLSG
ncbi:serine/threonine-protein kinase [Argonema galeatum]|uniref:serine/threonine-protein kinase n=1 Tax=Argonema galeatum TaxID=2942762 RepID=UPI002012AC52|nr:serine/threonine-protein kinase [Argonema galeatum]MCL1466855.1 serine/threonine protein kinase [Argonema galeatum A003/A1]